MIKRYLYLLLSLLLVSSLEAQIKVACVGNSVTYGAGIEDREKYAYPSQLQNLLGDNYEVRNFGHSGATLLRKGHRPYNTLPEYKKALDFAADIVIIHLGLNDTDPRNWPDYGDQFIADYMTLVRSFQEVNPKAEIYICRMSPIFHPHGRFECGTREWYRQIQKVIEHISFAYDLPLIDLQKPLYNKPYLLPDAIHPNGEGAGLIAQEVYAALTGDFGGLKMADVFSDNMVLQRGKSIKIHGTADAGEKVKVSIGGKKERIETNTHGEWEVKIDSLPVGGPYELTVSTDKKHVVFKNVLVGDVWLCSGQSNMYFKVYQSVEKEELLAHAANKPQIRIYNMEPQWQTNHVSWPKDALDSINKLQYFKTIGWEQANEKSVMSSSAVAYAYAKTLSDSLGIPIGIIHNSIGGSTIQSWIDRSTIEKEIPQILHNWTSSAFTQLWARQRASMNIKNKTTALQRHPYEPTYLFESGMKPLVDFAIKGVIWYQGESNADNIDLHEQLFPMLVKSWRGYFGENLPFYYVQLSSLNRPSWPLFRDSQRRLLGSSKNLGMAVCTDLGDSLDVHPRRKMEVGNRLASWALANTYGFDVAPSGPLYKATKFSRNKAIVEFDFSDGLTSVGSNPIIGFEVADESGIFYTAEAKIIGEKVQLSSKEVKKPVYVRYGWQPYTRANLINKHGLPASTFQSKLLFQ